MAPMPQKSLALLTWLYTHRFNLAMQFGLRIFAKDDPKKAENQLQFTGDHAISIDGDADSSTPAAFLAIMTSKMNYERLKWFITNEAAGSFYFLDPPDTWKTSIVFVPETCVILFKVQDTGSQIERPENAPAYSKHPKLMADPQGIAAMHAADNIASGLAKVRALLLEFLPDNETYNFHEGEVTNTMTKTQLLREVDQLFQLRNFLNFQTNG